jgi:transcriptional regulator with XRE-family HTH domain
MRIAVVLSEGTDPWWAGVKYESVLPMANAIDLHVGKRLRRRRRLLGLTQQQLAESIGIRFQQIQKYECGANRVTASRLYELAVALNVPVNYFFEGLSQVAVGATPGAPANDRDLIAADVLSQKETLELIRAYYKLGERPRRRLLDLAKALQEENHDAA